MALLLDTHALIWWVTGNERMPLPVRTAIQSGQGGVFVSAATAWEVTTKHRQGKLDEMQTAIDDFPGFVDRAGFQPLSLSVGQAALSGRLPPHHRDPFDRMLIAQALSQGLTLISNETLFDLYGVERLW
ncbi:MAG: type II toxin-antitoxin system VapC family toxin [Pseudomonadota bacterium]